MGWKYGQNMQMVGVTQMVSPMEQSDAALLPCPHNRTAAAPRLRQIPEDERFAARLRRPDTTQRERPVSSQWKSNIGAATSFERWSAATPPRAVHRTPLNGIVGKVGVTRYSVTGATG
ncbi:hypothetical protein EYF80_027343 [Liparis tanakae]|uniref:Uncharacterized protein n=1 Tax=Liparis tanakae TaxID=230148 RepID=A0A4Z2HAZ5_9TELE|nr:hypothetical protein EYF80_027343 [Liparis tanakae]